MNKVSKDLRMMDLISENGAECWRAASPSQIDGEQWGLT